MDTPFIDPEGLNPSQVFFIFSVYAYVLYQGSNLISDGSELLQLVPSISGIVGCIVLPILGAVPDGMMVLFSGLGPDAQEQVSVGVGALAGSTIMLLTLPWFLAVLGGRVSIVGGILQYKRPSDAGDDWEKLTPPGSLSLTGTGVSVLDSVRFQAKLMVGTCALYGVIQIPASMAEKKLPGDTLGQAGFENMAGLLGMIGCLAGFIIYLVVMYKDAQNSSSPVQDDAIQKIVDAIKCGKLSIRAVMTEFRKRATEGGSSLDAALLDNVPQQQLSWMKKILWPFFTAYDINGDRKIDLEEFKMILKDLGENSVSAGPTIQKVFSSADSDKSGKIEFDEFVKALIGWALDPKKDYGSADGASLKRNTVATYMDGDEGDDDDGGEEEDVPEDLSELSPEEQQKRIIMRSCYMMGLGTLLVLIFSDPMVDVLGDIGRRINVGSFYVAFILAPLASNASELIAAYNYAQKKTSKAMAISFSSLEGAACMNNTFCLGIFLALVYFKGLAWQFTAETISIVAVQLVMAVIVFVKQTQTMMDACIILGLYPLSLVFVWFLENIMGLD